MSPTSFHLRLAIDTLLVPAFVAAAGAVVVRIAPARWREALVAATLAAGSVAAHAGIVGWPRMPPIDTLGWLIAVVPAAAVLFAPFDLWPRAPRWGLPVAAGLLLVVASWLLLRPLGASLGGSGLAWRVGISVAAGLVPLVVLRGPFERGGSAAFLAGLATSAAGAGLVVADDRSTLLGQLFGGHAAAFAAAALASLVLPSFRLGRAAPAVAVVAYFGTLVYATFFAPLPPLAAALLALGPLAPLAARRVRRSWLAAGLSALIALSPATASWLVVRADQARRAAEQLGAGR